MHQLQSHDNKPRSAATRLGDDLLLVNLSDVIGPILVIPVSMFLFVKWTWRLCRWMGREGPSFDCRAWLDGGFGRTR